MESLEIRRVAVVGAGLMGHGIAQEFAHAGYEVTLHDQSMERLQRAPSLIEGNLTSLERTGQITTAQATAALSRIRPVKTLPDAVAHVDLVIEAVSEDLAVKQPLFRDLDALSPPHAILASNTSTFMPSRLAEATNRPEKVLVAHWFNPPYLVPIVEVVRGSRTTDATVATVRDLLAAMGKQPVVLQRELPGFLANRLQAALFREALSLVDQGTATPGEIDAVIRYGIGPRWAAAGVFEVWELGGWDVILAICDQLFPDLAAHTEAPALLRDMVARGDLGVKSGHGFYEWTPETADALRSRIRRALIEIAGWE
jgi:3-hydroxybutyryl-CoA dehydrogenase